jgi:hypothetical protein
MVERRALSTLIHPKDLGDRTSMAAKCLRPVEKVIPYENNRLSELPADTGIA